MARINAVYTPPDRRGNGYASACVAAASRHAQTALASTCMLYTDLANPTSNKIYQALGYRAVADVQEWVFS
jgi:predicted GNAT family acetyltransferase